MWLNILTNEIHWIWNVHELAVRRVFEANIYDFCPGVCHRPLVKLPPRESLARSLNGGSDTAILCSAFDVTCRRWLHSLGLVLTIKRTFSVRWALVLALKCWPIPFHPRSTSASGTALELGALTAAALCNIQHPTWHFLTFIGRVGPRSKGNFEVDQEQPYMYTLLCYTDQY